MKKQKQEKESVRKKENESESVRKREKERVTVCDVRSPHNLNESSVNPKSTSNQSSKPCTVLQYPSKKVLCALPALSSRKSNSIAYNLTQLLIISFSVFLSL